MEGFPISSFHLPTIRLLDSNKDTWMDSNQVYTFIWIGKNNPKKDSGEWNCTKDACVISNILRNIASHVNTLNYSFRFNFYVSTTYQPWGDQSHRTPASETASLTLGHHHSHKVKPISSPFPVRLTATLPYQAHHSLYRCKLQRSHSYHQDKSRASTPPICQRIMHKLIRPPIKIALTAIIVSK